MRSLLPSFSKRETFGEGLFSGVSGFLAVEGEVGALDFGFTMVGRGCRSGIGLTNDTGSSPRVLSSATIFIMNV